MTGIIVAILGFALLNLPGWLLAMREEVRLGSFAAAGIGALFLVLIVAALVGEIAGPLPAWSVYLVALLFSLGAFWLRRADRWVRPEITTAQFAVPAIMAGLSITLYHLGFGTGHDPVIFRAWYNADWFKHLGHSWSAAQFGFPMVDIFDGQNRLQYYWLFYLIPGAGASLVGDVPNALLAANVMIVFCFWLLLQETFRACGLGAIAAALLTLFGWVADQVSTIFTLIEYRFDLRAILDHVTVNTAALDELNSYIPQHALMMCGALAFLLLVVMPNNVRLRHLLGLAPAAGAGAVSTLLGATVVACCCAITALFARLSMVARTGVATATGVLSLGLVFGLHVLDSSIGQATMESPLFASRPPLPPLQRLSELMAENISLFGLTIFLGVAGMVRALQGEDDDRRRLAGAASIFFLFGLGSSILATLFLEPRLAGEIAIRNKYLEMTGLLIGMALLVARLPEARRYRKLIAAGFVVTALVSLPTMMLKILWTGWSGPQYQVAVPRDDMRAMAFLNRHSPPDALVLQYPEAPHTGLLGDDSWVPIFAGRTIPASYRATVWSRAAPVVDRMDRYYRGDPRLKPGRAIDWVYLSRSLHPDSYDALRTRLAADPAWEARLVLPEASLFERAVGEQRTERE